MRRTPRVVIDRRGALISLAAELRTRTLVVDVEPLLSPWDTAAERVAAPRVPARRKFPALETALRHPALAPRADAGRKAD